MAIFPEHPGRPGGKEGSGAFENTIPFDVLVLGGGPAGCAAAIKSAESGLKVAVVERNKFPRERLGETFQPNIESLLIQLGVQSPASVSALQRVCPTNWILDGLTHRFESAAEEPFAQAKNFLPFFGSVDLALYRRARDLGVVFFSACKAQEPVVENGRIAGIRTDKGAFRARFVIDAGGGGHWLANQLKLRIQPGSPSLTAIMGYAEGDADESLALHPRIKLDSKGWTWICRVVPHLYKWTRVYFSRDALPLDWVPGELKHMIYRGSRNPVDVTWRNVNQPAGPGFFLIGDAAAVLDPASSQGVVKALMGALLVSHLLPKIIKGEMQESQAVDIYSRSIANWFRQEVSHLRNIYSVYPEWQESVGYEARPNPLMLAK